MRILKFPAVAPSVNVVNELRRLTVNVRTNGTYHRQPNLPPPHQQRTPVSVTAPHPTQTINPTTPPPPLTRSRSLRTRILDPRDRPDTESRPLSLTIRDKIITACDRAIISTIRIKPPPDYKLPTPPLTVI